MCQLIPFKFCCLFPQGNHIIHLWIGDNCFLFWELSFSDRLTSVAACQFITLLGDNFICKSAVVSSHSKSMHTYIRRHTWDHSTDFLIKGQVNLQTNINVLWKWYFVDTSEPPKTFYTISSSHASYLNIYREQHSLPIQLICLHPTLSLQAISIPHSSPEITAHLTSVLFCILQLSDMDSCFPAYPTAAANSWQTNFLQNENLYKNLWTTCHMNADAIKLSLEFRVSQLWWPNMWQTHLHSIPQINTSLKACHHWCFSFNAYNNCIQAYVLIFFISLT